jgi:hypothetical protein
MSRKSLVLVALAIGLALIGLSAFTPSARADSGTVAIRSECSINGHRITITGTNLDGPIFMTVSGPEIEGDLVFGFVGEGMPFSGAVLDGWVTSIRGPKQNVRFLDSSSYIFALWGGTYESGPQTILAVCPHTLGVCPSTLTLTKVDGELKIWCHGGVIPDYVYAKIHGMPGRAIYNSLLWTGQYLDLGETPVTRLWTDTEVTWVDHITNETWVPCYIEEYQRWGIGLAPNSVHLPLLRTP